MDGFPWWAGLTLPASLTQMTPSSVINTLSNQVSVPYILGNEWNSFKCGYRLDYLAIYPVVFGADKPGLQ